LLDVDAAGYGWFIDSTPSNDREFQQIVGGSELQATAGSEAADRVDLLTVVTHEFGHLIGLPDLRTAVFPHHIMNETIGRGTRRSPDFISHHVDPISHHVDPYVPNTQPPHVFFNSLRANLSMADSTARSTQTISALDRVLADEDSRWDDVVELLLTDKEALDTIFQKVGA